MRKDTRFTITAGELRAYCAAAAVGAVMGVMEAQRRFEERGLTIRPKQPFDEWLKENESK